MIPKLDVDTRGAFIEALTAAGFRVAKSANKDDKQAAPSAEIGQLTLWNSAYAWAL